MPAKSRVPAPKRADAASHPHVSVSVREAVTEGLPTGDLLVEVALPSHDLWSGYDLPRIRLSADEAEELSDDLLKAAEIAAEGF